MKIRFTLTLTDETVNAFDAVEECATGQEIAEFLKDVLALTIKGVVEENALLESDEEDL